MVDSISPVNNMEDVTTQTLADKNAAMSSAVSNGDVDMGISEEEEARLAIESLKGDDVTERIAAANKLDIIAKVLGEERTRMVSVNFCLLHVRYSTWLVSSCILRFYR